ncbi:conserved hypothetical protein [Clostridium botulinum B str. Eklund 17B (NRP)]|nr:HNH/endonuclease VII fold putative polymorphic toxin [Clostridium botulinum]CDH90547.1 conserved hypothetical protein [Clostridium botulinum B str. Eklund 17B (NRP)]
MNPKKGQISEPEAQKEEKKGFNLGKLLVAAIAVVADSLLNQAIEGTFSLGKTLFDGLIGSATAVLLHEMGKLVSKVSPYIKTGIGKVFTKLSVGAKNILNKVSGKADDILGAFSKTSRELFEKVSNKVGNVVNSIKNSAQDLADRICGKFNEVTSRIDNKIDDALNYVKKPVNKFLIEKESTLQKLAKNLDDRLAPIRVVTTPEGIKIPIREEGNTKIQDTVSKIVNDAKDSAAKAAGKAEGQVGRNAAFRAAKRAAKIPNSTQGKKPVQVFDSSSENRIVHEFEVDGQKKYIIEHREDKFGRGFHFHGADDLKESPLKKR